MHVLQATHLHFSRRFFFPSSMSVTLLVLPRILLSWLWPILVYRPTVVFVFSISVVLIYTTSVALHRFFYFGRYRLLTVSGRSPSSTRIQWFSSIPLWKFLFSMSVVDCCSVWNLGKAYPYRGDDASMKTYLPSRTANRHDVDGSAPSQLKVLPLGNLIVAPVSVGEYLDNFHWFFNARRLTAMHLDGGKLAFCNVRCGRRRDIALPAWKKRWMLFDWNAA